MAQATHKVSWATRPGLDEVLSLSEEPDASSYDADAELEKLLPIAERISQCKEEALKGVLDPDLADLCLAAALLISRVDCLRPSEEGLVALKRMFTEASLGPLADWALEMKVQYSEAIPCETAASIFALQLRLVQVWANGGTLGFLGWPRGPGGPFGEEPGLTPHWTNASMPQTIMSWVCPDDDGTAFLRANRRPGMLAIAQDEGKPSILRKVAIVCVGFCCFQPNSMTQLNYVLSDHEMWKRMACLVRAQPADESMDTLATISLFSYETQLFFAMGIACTCMRNISKHPDAPNLLERLGPVLAQHGVIDIFLRQMFGFNRLQRAEDVADNFPRTMILLNLLCSDPANAQLVRERAVAMGRDDKALATALLDVAERCTRPEPLLGVRGDRKAYSMLALLYGRAEDGEANAPVIPPRVAEEMVKQLANMVGCADNGNVADQITGLVALSISDKNTRTLVDAGVIEVAIKILTQGQDEVDAFFYPFQYPVATARELASWLVMNLALSTHTAESVAKHEGLTAAIKQAMGDEELLSKKTKQRLQDCLFQFEMTVGSGKEAAAERAAAVEADTKHLMLSYCWAQQTVILRIREAIRLLGYPVWIVSLQSKLSYCFVFTVLGGGLTVSSITLTLNAGCRSDVRQHG